MAAINGTVASAHSMTSVAIRTGAAARSAAAAMEAVLRKDFIFRSSWVAMAHSLRGNDEDRMKTVRPL
ncbi:hypothetical protein [Bordetella genomosp. 13]|uniref:Uncharacterized protein n=1 Tax=Bordetella genomosp. 13 TaxID=463040 RepID=A0A1W6ZG47_9BORD|nr:hypothetical protein [Bordetella genomosp. 13]ARP96319.1 hypothetical protein CAL15_19245 [Bordetella genomosp. 13]